MLRLFHFSELCFVCLDLTEENPAQAKHMKSSSPFFYFTTRFVNKICCFQLISRMEKTFYYFQVEHEKFASVKYVLFCAFL